MKVTSLEFRGTFVSPKADLPGPLPQIAFAGRSNVGKSSLINTLLGRTKSKIAKVSATPGKTQGLNFYEVNETFFLVDLPGWGFAQAPLSVRETWEALVNAYLARPDGPIAVVFLLDLRRDPSPDDLRMLERLAELGIPALIVLTKIDKFTFAARQKRVRELIGGLGLEEAQVVPFSSKTGEGRELLSEAIEALLAEATA